MRGVGATPFTVSVPQRFIRTPEKLLSGKKGPPSGPHAAAAACRAAEAASDAEDAAAGKFSMVRNVPPPKGETL